MGLHLEFTIPKGHMIRGSGQWEYTVVPTELHWLLDAWCTLTERYYTIQHVSRVVGGLGL